ncbi:MAG: hypothetical protein HQ546_02475, partial [Planctomycetes bacterium]|nr:hypothetical protein [Planctomycetota bacterium]
MKALLLRVGIDKGCGGCLAPIFKDGSFEYIPIPERSATTAKKMYSDLRGRGRRSLAAFVPPKLRYYVPHFDPEFTTFTYGDPTPNKRRQLAKLETGDLLIFYAGLEPPGTRGKSRLYVIGYFTVQEVHDFRKIAKAQWPGALRKVRNNAHAKRRHRTEDLVIVKGNPKRSRLLSKAIPLGDSGNRVKRGVRPIVGVSCSILRAIGHWIDGRHVSKVVKWLGAPKMRKAGPSLFSYVLVSDTGFAPNVTGEKYCTLACCKPVIRRVAEKGDWVMGTYRKKEGARKLAFVMQVSEVMSFDEYFRDARFKCKKPTADPHGDNIYRLKNGRLSQVGNATQHTGKEARKRDTKVDRVLVAEDFWYFGDRPRDVPERFKSLITNGRGHRRIRLDEGGEEGKLAKGFVRWIRRKKRGKRSRPRHADDQKRGT